MKLFRKSTLALMALTLAPAVALGAGGGAAGASAPSIPVAPENAALAAAVRGAINGGGPLPGAPDATYAPDEFVAANGTTVVGMDADLADAIGQVLGLKVTLVNATFDTIIPALQSGKYDLGMSSFTDTKAREKVVNFVDYYVAGEGFYVAANSKYHPNGLSSLCGHAVSVESGTTEQSDAQAQAKTCKKDKKGAVKVLSYETQSEANLAVSSGRASVGFADSQIAQYIVAQSNGQFKNSGKAFETAPYGIAVPKGTTLDKSVQGAVKVLMSDGIYLKILKKWGIQAGAVKADPINAATS
jgi:polar amino acid transport system substrate-binding protein